MHGLTESGETTREKRAGKESFYLQVFMVVSDRRAIETLLFMYLRR